MGLLSGVVDLLLPRRCPACRRPCTSALCPTCAYAAAALVLDDLGFEQLDDGVVAVGAYAYEGVIQRAVRAVKVGGLHAGVPALGQLMWAAVGPSAWPVTWVPSTARRRRMRGAEIPRLLAGPGAVPLLREVGERPDQTALGARQRRASPVGAFRPTGHVPPAVTVVDDVRTTGATALAAADALRHGGARRVLVVTFAVAGRGGQAVGVSAGSRSWMG